MLSSLTKPALTRTYKLYPDPEHSSVGENNRGTMVDVKGSLPESSADYYLVAERGEQGHLDSVSYLRLHKSLQQLGAAERAVDAVSLAEAMEPAFPGQPYYAIKVMSLDCDLVEPSKQKFRLQGDTILYTVQLQEELPAVKALPASPAQVPSPGNVDLVDDILTPMAEQMGWQML